MASCWRWKEYLYFPPCLSGCVLVTEGSKLLGILTERDIVRLTAIELVFEEVTIAEVMTQPVVTLPQQSGPRCPWRPPG